MIHDTLFSLSTSSSLFPLWSLSYHTRHPLRVLFYRSSHPLRNIIETRLLISYHFSCTWRGTWRYVLYYYMIIVPPPPQILVNRYVIILIKLLLFTSPAINRWNPETTTGQRAHRLQSTLPLLATTGLARRPIRISLPSNEPTRIGRRLFHSCALRACQHEDLGISSRGLSTEYSSARVPTPPAVGRFWILVLLVFVVDYRDMQHQTQRSMYLPNELLFLGILAAFVGPDRLVW